MGKMIDAPEHLRGHGSHTSTRQRSGHFQSGDLAQRHSGSRGRADDVGSGLCATVYAARATSLSFKQEMSGASHKRVSATRAPVES